MLSMSPSYCHTEKKESLQAYGPTMKSTVAMECHKMLTLIDHMILNWFELDFSVLMAWKTLPVVVLGWYFFQTSWNDHVAWALFYLGLLMHLQSTRVYHLLRNMIIRFHLYQEIILCMWSCIDILIIKIVTKMLSSYVIHPTNIPYLSLFILVKKLLWRTWNKCNDKSCSRPLRTRIDFKAEVMLCVILVFEVVSPCLAWF